MAADTLPDKEELEMKLEEKTANNKKSLLKFLGGKLPEEKNVDADMFKKKADKEGEEPETAAEALQRILVSPECPKARGFEA